MSNHKWLQTAFKATILFFTLFIIENSQKKSLINPFFFFFLIFDP